jgi:hypothetical protein
MKLWQGSLRRKSKLRAQPTLSIFPEKTHNFRKSVDRLNKSATSLFKVLLNLPHYKHYFYMSFLFVLLRDQYFLKIKNNKILPFGRNGVLQYWGEIFKLFRTCFYKLKIIVLMRENVFGHLRYQWKSLWRNFNFENHK